MLNFEKDYDNRLQEALKNENYNQMMSLMFDLNVLRKFYKKKLFKDKTKCRF